MTVCHTQNLYRYSNHYSHKIINKSFNMDINTDIIKQLVVSTMVDSKNKRGWIKIENPLNNAAIYMDESSKYKGISLYASVQRGSKPENRMLDTATLLSTLNSDTLNLLFNK